MDIIMLMKGNGYAKTVGGVMEKMFMITNANIQTGQNHQIILLWYLVKNTRKKPKI